MTDILNDSRIIAAIISGMFALLVIIFSSILKRQNDTLIKKVNDISDRLEKVESKNLEAYTGIITTAAKMMIEYEPQNQKYIKGNHPLINELMSHLSVVHLLSNKKVSDAAQRFCNAVLDEIRKDPDYKSEHNIYKSTRQSYIRSVQSHLNITIE